jgi:hypothetical protein
MLFLYWGERLKVGEGHDTQDVCEREEDRVIEGRYTNKRMTWKRNTPKGTSVKQKSWIVKQSLGKSLGLGLGQKNPRIFPRLFPSPRPRLFPRLCLTIQFYLPRLWNETEFFQDFSPDTIFIFKNRFLFPRLGQVCRNKATSK